MWIEISSIYVTQPLTFIGLICLKEINEIVWLQLLRVFSSNLNDNLKVLTKVGSKHFLQALKSLLYGKTAKVFNNPFGVEKISVR